ncbi:MAG TPA: PaaI family thioesterase [Euzebyales bacterium]|nr:PaaI family thioesterase [Euzebyales bacterium]
MSRIRLPRHWCGPDGIGQGGVTAGLVAADLLDGPVEVRLHAPAPLDTDMDVRRDDSGQRTLVAASDRLIATARRVTAIDGTPPPDIDLDGARSVTGALSHRNVFGHCLICGHHREDSLRVWPGPRPDARPGVVTAFDVPAPFRGDDGALATPFVFGALDCTSGFAVLRDSDSGVAITGTMQVQLERPVPAHAPVIAAAQVVGRGRRTWLVDAAVRSADGDVLARAHVIWVQIDPAVLGVME